MVDDLTAFRNWLQSHQTTDVVGFTRDPEHCPVATYLRDLGNRITSVTRHYQLCGDEISDNPVWMTEFISRIDKLLKPEDPITAGIALSVLCHIEGEIRMAPPPSTHQVVTLPVGQQSTSDPSQPQA